MQTKQAKFSKGPFHGGQTILIGVKLADVSPGYLKHSAPPKRCVICHVGQAFEANKCWDIN